MSLNGSVAGNALKNVVVLGSTGSIGESTLDVIERHSDRFRVFALVANRSTDGMFRQCQSLSPQYAYLRDSKSRSELRTRLRDIGSRTEVIDSEAELEDICAHPEVDYVMAAIVGAAGLKPTLAAAKAGKRVLLANKEALVTAGHLFMQEIAASGAELLPIDSEHNAIFQCLPAHYNGDAEAKGITKILLTASGGPFRETPLSELVNVTPEQAIAHPNWSMGQKISVDSASLMNKGLELIEACWLFHAEPEFIEVVIHPQSVIHSMVEYSDGSVLAQMGSPDMRTPIAYGLGWPERINAGVSPLDFVALGKMTFEAPDLRRFPCLKLAGDAFKAGGNACAVLNAANEIAVAGFLNGNLRFTEIPSLIQRVLDRVDIKPVTTIEDVFDADRSARASAAALLTEMN